VATLEFRLADGVEEVCDASALVTFAPVSGSSSALGTPEGGLIIPNTIDLGPVSASTEPLGLVGVPDGWQRPADAGRLGSVLADPQVTGSLPCSSTPPMVNVVVEYPSGHAPATGDTWPADGLFPVGTTRVTWSVEAVPGDASSAFTATREFTVFDYALMDLEIAMPGVMSAAHQRSIDIKFGSGTWMTAGTVLVTPSGSGLDAEGRGSMQVQVPVTTVGTDCIAVRDPIHTIADAGNPALSGLTWSLSVILKQGDSNGDNRVDILDYMFFLLDFTGTPAAADGRSNFNGDAIVNTSDFSFISVNFFSIGETCGGGTASDGARDRMSVAELRKLGLGELAIADLNRDGWVDTGDMALWMQGVRPESEAGDSSESGSVAE
jgi:hypothetical protein